MVLKKILLVEDDEAIAQTLIFSLEREGWQVQWFNLGLPALAYLNTHDIDFIILDVGLPDTNGFDLCRQIRQQHQTPLLFLTARNDEIERIIGCSRLRARRRPHRRSWSFPAIRCVPFPHVVVVLRRKTVHRSST